MAPAGPAMHWEVHPMERLTDAIATLVYQPVKIERIASEQTDTLNASIGDAFTLDGAVDTIYESCLTERGFRLVCLQSMIMISWIDNDTFSGAWGPNYVQGCRTASPPGRARKPSRAR